MVHSDPGMEVRIHVVITTSDAYKSLWSEQDGDVPFLHKLQQDFFFSLQNISGVF